MLIIMKQQCWMSYPRIVKPSTNVKMLKPGTVTYNSYIDEGLKIRDMMHVFFLKDEINCDYKCTCYPPLKIFAWKKRCSMLNIKI